jgi:hypothetical protein
VSILNIFDNDAFGVVSRSRALSQQPAAPARVRSLGIFTPVPVATTTVALESIDGSLSIVPSTRRGGPGVTQQRDRATIRDVRIPRFAVEDVITADDLQNVRVLGTDSELARAESVFNEKVTKANRNLDTTEEFLLLGALRGLVQDRDENGNLRTLLDLHGLFGLTAPAPTDFQLTAANPARGALNDAVSAEVYAIEDALDGIPFDHVHAFVGRTFAKNFRSHPEFQAALLNEPYALRAERNGGEGYTWQFAGVTFEVMGRRINGAPFVGDNEAIFFPVGAEGVAEVYYGPADYVETANTIGLPRYVNNWALNPRARHVEVQMNVLPVWRKPAALRRAVGNT